MATREIGARRGCAAIWTLLATGAMGCAGTVQLAYRQVGACNGWMQGDITHSAGPNAAYTVYQVTSIDNSKNSSAFTLDPAKLFVNAGGAQPVASQITQDLAMRVKVPPLVAVTVAAQQQQQTSGYGVVVVPTTDKNGAAEANRTSYFLLYKTGSGEPGVVLTKDELGRTTWPMTEDCTAIKY